MDGAKLLGTSAVSAKVVSAKTNARVMGLAKRTITAAATQDSTENQNGLGLIVLFVLVQRMLLGLGK